MPKPDPTILLGPSGQAYAITITERGLRIDIDDQHRIVYTSVVTDGVRNLRFEVELVRPIKRSRLSTKNLNRD